MTSDNAVLEKLLRCPCCYATLEWAEDDLTCAGCDSVYPVIDGIPVMLPNELQRELDESEQLHKRQQAEYFSEHEGEDFEVSRPHGAPALYGWLMNEKFRRSMAGLDLSECRSVVTVCGGSGMDAEFLSRRGMTVIASDISLGAVRRARERAQRFGLKMSVVVADVERLPFADSSVDLVYVHDGLHHLTRPLIGLREMARVASHAVSITEPAEALATAIAMKLGLSIDVEEAGNRVERLEVSDIVATLEAANFRPVLAERYAMLYRHEPRAAMKLLSTPGLFQVTTVAWRALNAAIGRAGNKLTVQASR